MSKNVFSLACCAALAVVSAFGATPMHASTITYTGTGTGSDGPLSGSAVFTTSAGQVQITLSNTLPAGSIISAGQALSDLSFTFSNAPGTLGATSATGQLGTVSGTGAVTYTSGSPTRWLGAGGQGSFGVAANTVTLETVGGGKPDEMIAPSMANGGTYSSVNNGFQQFDPYVIGPASFTLAFTGITADTTITGATFSFGTGPDTFIQGTSSTTPPVPEPSSLLLLGTGIVGAAGLLRRRIVA